MILRTILVVLKKHSATVDGSEIPNNHHGMVLKPCKEWGFQLPTSTGPGFQPSTAPRLQRDPRGDS